MGNVIIKPLTRTETPDGPLYASEVGGAIVHHGKPMTPEEREGVAQIIEAAKRYLANMPKPD